MDNRRSDEDEGSYGRSRDDDMSARNDDWDDDEEYASDGGKSLLLWIGGGVLALVVVAFLVFFGRGGGGAATGPEQMEEIRKLQARIEQLETDARTRQEVVDRLNTDQAAFQEEWVKMVTKVEDLRKSVSDLSQKAGAPIRERESPPPALLPPVESGPVEPPRPAQTVNDSAASAPDSESAEADRKKAEADAEKKREAARKKAEAKKEAARKKAEEEKAAAEKESAEKPKKKAEAKETEKSDAEKAKSEKPKKSIPKSGYHVVEPGQNLYRLSLMYGISEAELRRLNGLKTDQVNIGQKLYLRPIQ